MYTVMDYFTLGSFRAFLVFNTSISLTQCWGHPEQDQENFSKSQICYSSCSDATGEPLRKSSRRVWEVFLRVKSCQYTPVSSIHCDSSCKSFTASSQYLILIHSHTLTFMCFTYSLLTHKTCGCLNGCFMIWGFKFLFFFVKGNIS